MTPLNHTSVEFVTVEFYDSSSNIKSFRNVNEWRYVWITARSVLNVLHVRTLLNVSFLPRSSRVTRDVLRDDYKRTHSDSWRSSDDCVLVFLWLWVYGDISEEGWTDFNSLALFTDISQESPVGRVTVAKSMPSFSFSDLWFLSIESLIPFAARSATCAFARGCMM